MKQTTLIRNILITIGFAAVGAAGGRMSVLGVDMYGALIIPIAIAVVLVTCILLKTFANPEWGLLWAGTLSVLGTISLLTVGEVNIKPYQIFLMVALTGVIGALGLNKRMLSSLPLMVYAPILCFMTWALLSITVAQSVTLAAKQYILLALYIIMFLAIAAVPDYRFFKRLSLYIVYISIPICLVGIIQMIGMAYLGMKLAYLNASFMRAYSIFKEANEFSQYLIFVFPFILCGLYTRNRTRVFAHWAALLLTLACLLFSMSRGGWLGAGISVLIIWAGIKTAEDKLIWLNVHRLNLIFGAMGVLVVIIAFQASFIKADVLLRRSTSLFSGADNTASLRLEQNVKALKLMTEHPFTGVGIGNLGYNLGSATSSNMFADIGAETGVPGLLLFSLSILSIIFVGINGICRHAKVKGSKLLILAALASFAGVIANGLTYAAHLIPFLWLSAAIIVGATYSRITGEASEEKHDTDG